MLKSNTRPNWVTSASVATAVLILVSVVGIFAGPAWSSGEAGSSPSALDSLQGAGLTLRFDPSAASVGQGEQVSVDLILDNPDRTAAWELALLFDPDRLDLVGAVPDNFIGDPAAGCDHTTTRCVKKLPGSSVHLDLVDGARIGQFSFGSGAPPIGGSGSVAQLTFQATATGPAGPTSQLWVVRNWGTESSPNRILSFYDSPWWGVEHVSARDLLAVDDQAALQTLGFQDASLYIMGEPTNLGETNEGAMASPAYELGPVIGNFETSDSASEIAIVRRFEPSPGAVSRHLYVYRSPVNGNEEVFVSGDHEDAACCKPSHDAKEPEFIFTGDFDPGLDGDEYAVIHNVPAWGGRFLYFYRSQSAGGGEAGPAIGYGDPEADAMANPTPIFFAAADYDPAEPGYEIVAVRNWGTEPSPNLFLYVYGSPIANPGQMTVFSMHGPYMPSGGTLERVFGGDLDPTSPGAELGIVLHRADGSRELSLYESPMLGTTLLGTSIVDDGPMAAGANVEYIDATAP